MQGTTRGTTMFQAFLRTSLRFWFRLGLVLTVPWLIGATLWHVAAAGREANWHLSRDLQACDINGQIDSVCIHKATALFRFDMYNEWFWALTSSAEQLALLWIIGLILVAGLRWAARAL